MPTPAELYIENLMQLKPGDLGLLRSHAYNDLDESIDGFDLFTGLWWPLRKKNQAAPRRKVAWLIAKLYAFRPLLHSPGETLAYQLGRCRPKGTNEKEQFQKIFDEMLTLPLDQLEPALRYSLDLLASKQLKLDWVRLTNDLSIWEKENTRLKWAKDFLKTF